MVGVRLSNGVQAAFPSSDSPPRQGAAFPALPGLLCTSVRKEAGAPARRQPRHCSDTRITHCPWLLCARVAGVRERLCHTSRVCNVGPPDAGRCASSGASRRPAVPAHLHPRRALSSELPLGGWVGASPAPGDERLGYLGATLVRLAPWRMQPVRDSCQAIAIWYLVQNGPLNRVT